jgi:hypothetical protein
MNAQVWQDIFDDFHRGVIDYRSPYLLLYASYNRWYRATTGTSISVLALESVIAQTQVWRKLFDNPDSHMVTYMRKLYVLTTLAPVPSPAKKRWQGSLTDTYDWQGLIWLWYGVRCLISHGYDRQQYPQLDSVLLYAYESLKLFMVEILKQAQWEGTFCF